MKNFNFILFHKAIDNVLKAHFSVDKASHEVYGSTYGADITYEEYRVLEDVKGKMETAKALLNEIAKDLANLDKPT